MFRQTAALALLFSTTAALADIGPPIAFSKGGQIYLATADGSSIQLLYKAPSRKSVFDVKLKPGGGEIAFEETACCSVPQTSLLKVVSFDNEGRKGATTSTQVCGRVWGIDYHTTDGTLLYSDCNAVMRRLDPTDGTSVPVALPDGGTKPAWVNADDFLFVQAGKIWRASITAPASPSEVATIDFVQSLNASHASNEALIGYAYDGSIKLLNLTTRAISTVTQGTDASFSPADNEYIYITPKSKGGQYILIQSFSGGSHTQIGGKASYSSVDWRN